MNISKIYTKTMHKALQNALKNNLRIDYSPKGGFIKHIYSTRQGVVFSFNTYIVTSACMSTESFVKYDYSKVLDDLQIIYHKCLTDSVFQLESEYYQDRYSVKM